MSVKMLSRHIMRLSLRSNSTHVVFNQSRPLIDFDVYKSDPSLVESVSIFNGSHVSLLEEFGKKCGTSKLIDISETAEKNKPTLRNFDRYGHRIDVADYHDAYHSLMKHGIEHGAACHGFKFNIKGSQVTRAALIYMENQVEAGHCCPIVMTAAAIPVLMKSPGMEEYVTKIYSQQYDPRNLPISQKTGVTIGMSMTEKQGGSDVRANTTIATAIPGSTDRGYLLYGHKWFTSAPMCDAFLTLAKTSPTAPPSCFLVPRWKPDETRNTGFQVMRLKDKLGDRANASSEVEYHNAFGQLIGEEGKGVKTIIEMVQSTRLDCALGSAGAARRAVQIALNHADSRSAFGRPLLSQPLMRNLLTDLCVEAEAHTMNAMYLANEFDKYYSSSSSTSNVGSEADKDLFRIAVTISKYYITKRLPGFTYECMEALGGNGFVKDFPMARLFRQSPLNAIWEGSGNVIALDILRGYKALPTVMADINTVRGMDSRLDNYLDQLDGAITHIMNDPLSSDNQKAARNIVDRLAVALQASIMLRFGDQEVAAAYLASRIPQQATATFSGVNYGGYTVYSDKTCDYILNRNMPKFF